MPTFHYCNQRSKHATAQELHPVAIHHPHSPSPPFLLFFPHTRAHPDRLELIWRKHGKANVTSAVVLVVEFLQFMSLLSVGRTGVWGTGIAVEALVGYFDSSFRGAISAYVLILIFCSMPSSAYTSSYTTTFGAIGRVYMVSSFAPGVIKKGVGVGGGGGRPCLLGLTRINLFYYYYYFYLPPGDGTERGGALAAALLFERRVHLGGGLLCALPGDVLPVAGGRGPRRRWPPARHHLCRRGRALRNPAGVLGGGGGCLCLPLCLYSSI